MNLKIALALTVALGLSSQLQAAAMLSCGASTNDRSTRPARAGFGVSGPCLSQEAFASSLEVAGLPRVGWRGPLRIPLPVVTTAVSESTPVPTPWTVAGSRFSRRWYGALAMHDNLMFGRQGGLGHYRVREYDDFDEFDDDLRPIHGGHGHHKPPAPVPLPPTGLLAASALLAMLATRRSRRSALPVPDQRACRL